VSISALAGSLVVVKLFDLEFMKDKQNSLAALSLPPRLPQNEAELRRTIILLGNRKQVELKTDARRQLESLIGVYPTIKEATLWKRVLRRACQGKFPTAK
jgi:hypothetical protein